MQFYNVKHSNKMDTILFQVFKDQIILSGKRPSKRWHSKYDSKFKLFSVIFIKVENHNRKL